MWADSSDQIDALAASLVKALGEMHDLPKTQTANVGKYNYSYATLADALQLARPIFAKHDLALTQTVATLNNEIAVYTTVIHSSGQFVTPFPSDDASRQNSTRDRICCHLRSTVFAHGSSRASD
jgi:hypothetical protein